MTARVCSDCPAPISARSRGGRCRSCTARHLNADPVIAAQRLAGMRAHYADPVNLAAARERHRRMGANMPERERQRRSERGKLLAKEHLLAANAAMTAETRAENGRKRTATMLAWCPPAWRDTYRAIKLRGRKAADAKRIVLDLIAGRPGPELYAQQKAKLAWCPAERRDEYRSLARTLGAAAARAAMEEMLAAEARRADAAMTPFDRQLAAVRAGARLIEKPVFRRADPAFSLVGNATGML